MPGKNVKQTLIFVTRLSAPADVQIHRKFGESLESV
jgi:hypothetical protein